MPELALIAPAMPAPLGTSTGPKANQTATAARPRASAGPHPSGPRSPWGATPQASWGRPRASAGPLPSSPRSPWGATPQASWGRHLPLEVEAELRRRARRLQDPRRGRRRACRWLGALARGGGIGGKVDRHGWVLPQAASDLFATPSICAVRAIRPAQSPSAMAVGQRAPAAVRRSSEEAPPRQRGAAGRGEKGRGFIDSSSMIGARQGSKARARKCISSFCAEPDSARGRVQIHAAPQPRCRVRAAPEPRVTRAPGSVGACPPQRTRRAALSLKCRAASWPRRGV